MQISTQQYKTVFKLFLLAFGFLLPFIAFPQTGNPNCELVSGQFRNFDYAINFPTDSNPSVFQNWFPNAVMQNNSQPFVYLDLKFSDQCPNGSFAQIKVLEADTLVLGGFDDEVAGAMININQNQLEQTLVFRAGDTGCAGINNPDCHYYATIDINSSSDSLDYDDFPHLYFFSNCYDSCDDQSWSYLGVANSGNVPGYSYGSYFSENDPDLLNDQALTVENNSSLDAENNSALEIENNTLPPATSILTEEGKIENPLGPAGTLPAFIQSLLAIIIRAGIPLVVLALVYTGFRFVEARGNPTKITEAKKVLLYTVIGTAVLLGAWTIVTILSNTIGDIIAHSIINLISIV